MRLSPAEHRLCTCGSLAKDILDAGFHPRGVFHLHRHSQGWGADARLRAQRGRGDGGTPASFHVFVAYRRGHERGSAVTHVH
jgi:hypothetical protein